jgi:zinc transporter
MNEQTGLINAFVLDAKGGGMSLDWAGIRRWTPAQGVIWVHPDFTVDEGRHRLAEHSGLDPLVAEVLLADETRPRCLSVVVILAVMILLQVLIFRRRHWF